MGWGNFVLKVILFLVALSAVFSNGSIFGATLSKSSVFPHVESSSSGHFLIDVSLRHVHFSAGNLLQRLSFFLFRVRFCINSNVSWSKKTVLWVRFP